MSAFRLCLPVAGLALSVGLAACGRSMVPMSPSGTQYAGPADSERNAQTAEARRPIAESGAYMVVWAPPDGLLPVREPAGTQGAVVDSLRRDQRGIRLTGRTTQLGSSHWVEIVRPDGGTGWVNEWNLTPDVSAAEFCADDRVTGLIARLRSAVSTEDGQSLAELISSRHGLVIRLDWWNPEVVYSRGSVPQLFHSPEAFDWGTARDTGTSIRGSFPTVVLPALQSGLGEEAVGVRCDALATGETGRPTRWPREYANLNFYSVYTPASPVARFSWRTWAIGFEYVDGAPYVTVLVQYRAEI